MPRRRSKVTIHSWILKIQGSYLMRKEITNNEQDLFRASNPMFGALRTQSMQQCSPKDL